VKKYVNGKYVDLTAEELSALEAKRRKATLAERTRPLTVEEVTRMFLTQQVNTLEVDDNTALRMREFYPEWAPDTAYGVGFKVRRGDGLWKCLQAHTAQVGWEPEAAPALWERVCESHDGTEDDPVPYGPGMTLEEGKFYHQEFVIYRCVRSTGQPVYHALSELVGLYVEGHE
jgi:hypothetical protein